MNKISPAFISANVHRAYLLQIRIYADPQETFSPQEKAPVPSYARNRGLVFFYANVHIPRICLRMIRGITYLFGTYRKMFRVGWRNLFFRAVMPAGNRAAYVPGWHALL